MLTDSYKRLCVHHVHDGLRVGLSHFSQNSRVAIIFAETEGSPLCVYDPQDLLRGHEVRLYEEYVESFAWREEVASGAGGLSFRALENDALDLSGLISFGAKSDTMYYQRWFTEHHPDMCSTGPTRRWLEHAAWLLSVNLATENFLTVDTAEHVLQQWAVHAVRNFILDRRSVSFMDSELRVYPVLDAVLGISKTLEEGAWPRGRIAFVEPRLIDDMNFVVRFPHTERPYLENFKHVRKLLQAAEMPPRRLVSDGKCIVGIAIGKPPEGSISALYDGARGYLRLDGEAVCSFYDGSFHSSTGKANLVLLEEALLGTDLPHDVVHDLFNIVTYLVHGAQDKRHGCTLIIDMDRHIHPLSGQHLSPRLPLTERMNLELAHSLSKVDGALHIGADLNLHAFACLLDGHTVPGENRARGARFNSALRFTGERADKIVIVVSSDRPVSIIQNGIELTAQCALPPVTCRIDCFSTLKQWVQDA